MRMWTAENRHYFEKTPLKNWNLVCYFSKTATWIHFLREISYSSEREEFIDQLVPEEFRNGYFQHDGATAQSILSFLKEFYDHRLIKLHTEHICPPRSPDLTPLDYFFEKH